MYRPRLAAVPLLALALLALPGSVPAQLPSSISPLEPASTGGFAALDRPLARLAVHKRLLVVAAHPDDEDTSLLTLCAGDRRRGGLPFALARRRRAEPDRTGAGHRPGADPLARAARGAAGGRRAAVLHPRLRLRLHALPRRDLPLLAEGGAARGRGADRPPLPAAGDRLDLPRRAASEPRPAPGRRLDGAPGLQDGRRRDLCGPRRGEPAALAAVDALPLDLLRGQGVHAQAVARADRSDHRQVDPPARLGEPQPAPLAGHGAHAGPRTARDR